MLLKNEEKKIKLYKFSDNNVSCANCPGGYACPGGIFTPGSSDQGKTACSCGYYSNGGASSCTGCGAGKWSYAGATSCNNISAGYYGSGACSSTPNACSNKPSNSYYTSNGGNSNSCGWTCNSGFTQLGTSCVCPKGYYGSGSCTACPSGYTSSAGTTSISHCYMDVPGGNYLGTAKGSTTTQCAAGTYRPGHNVLYGATSICFDCSTGYYSSAGASSCTACSNKPANSYYTSNATSDSCSWSCNSGYKKSGSSCVTDGCSSEYNLSSCYPNAICYPCTSNGTTKYKYVTCNSGYTWKQGGSGKYTTYSNHPSQDLNIYKKDGCTSTSSRLDNHSCTTDGECKYYTYSSGNFDLYVCSLGYGCYK